jgi:uncharacterized protein
MRGTYERLLNSIQGFSAVLSDRERLALTTLIPRQLLSPRGREAAFLYSKPEEILSLKEKTIFDDISSDGEITQTSTSGFRSQTFFVMKATRLCNLRCTYCHSWKEGPNQIMSFRVLAKTIHDALKSSVLKRAEFVWHGGEVSLLPLSFFKKALWLQNAFRRDDQVIVNAIQTNGTRLTNDWINFFIAGQFNVGISLDGPAEIHDARRRTAHGDGTWRVVVSAISRLIANGVQCGVLVVVDRKIARFGAANLLELLLAIGVRGVALLNVIPDNTSTPVNNDNYLPFSDYVKFLSQMFKAWWPKHCHRIAIRELDALTNNISNKEPTLCVFAGNCMGQFLTIEPTGEVSACDKYIGDTDYVFGNILESNLEDLVSHSANVHKARLTTRNYISRMSSCKFLQYCRGACPHDYRLNARYLGSNDGTCCGLSELIQEIISTVSQE